ncbi:MULTISPECIES: extracellular solute-binding protein [Paenibacillus]|uniref:extracellular solute-binding protein n=1 Tax=Paenibacillus TaxID=44249 RepID=UPI002FDFB41D
MKRRNHWVLFAILLLALINLSPSETSTLTSSEDRGESEPVAPQNREADKEPGHIAVAVQTSGAEFGELQQLNQKVMDETGMKVELTNLTMGSELEAIRQKLELGESPDVLLLDNAWVRQLASDGYLLPTENYYPGTLTGEVLSASLAQNEWNGYTWAVPLDIDPYVWVYRDDKLQAENLKLPLTTEDWKELLAKYKTQTHPPSLITFDYGDPYAGISLTLQLSGHTGSSDANSVFKRSKETEEAVKLLDALRPYLLHSGSGASGQDNVWNKLSSGEAIFGLVKWSEARRRNSGGLHIVFPDQAISGEMWITGRSYAVTAGSDNGEAAGRWIAAMTNQIQQRQWFELTGNLPVRKELYVQAEHGGIPAGLPPSLVKGKGTPVPAGAEIPERMEKYASVTAAFLKGGLGMQAYLNELSSLGL